MYSTADEEPDDLSLFFSLLLKAQIDLRWVYWGKKKKGTFFCFLLLVSKQLEHNTALPEIHQLLRAMPSYFCLNCSPFLHYLSRHQFPLL